MRDRNDIAFTPKSGNCGERPYEGVTLKLNNIMRLTGIICFALPVSACGQANLPEVQDCEANLLGGLKAPSTYKAIKKTSEGKPADKPDTVLASIEYDAANAYGTPIRSTYSCIYKAKAGRADISARLYQGDTSDDGSTGDPYADMERKESLERASKLADDAMNAALEAADNIVLGHQ